jgi:CO/xanthine dehydrogenase Mo-binding subunit
MKRLDALVADLDAWEVERKERVHELAEKHGMKPKEVRRRMLALSTYGVRRKPSSYNAKISRIMADLNECE